MAKKFDEEAEDLRIAGLSNFDLLEQTIGHAGGDDYDGCFTENGRLTFLMLKAELSKRLIDVGYIDQELEQTV